MSFGVQVDPASIQYAGSQPWPFPQSLMVGFTASISQDTNHEAVLMGPALEAAQETQVLDEEIQKYLGSPLPRPVPQEEEMEDVRWFHYDYLHACLSGESNGGGVAIPEEHAIANKIITDWMKKTASERDAWAGNNIQDVQIDEGRFKYILARVSDGEHSKIVVRGKRGRPYHMNVLEGLKAECSEMGLEATPLGGGRIEHNAATGEIAIYGYSSAFGVAVHDITAALCRRFFPFYDRIAFEYTGY